MDNYKTYDISQYKKLMKNGQPVSLKKLSKFHLELTI